MYQDLSFMKIPLPEDVLKLKNYGDYAGAQKMIRYFLEHKEIPKALRKRLEIEQEIIGVMGADEYPYTYAEALEMMTSHLRDFKEEELQYLKEIGAADWIYIDGEVHFQRLFYDNLIQTRPDLAARVIVQNEELEKENAMKQKLLNGNVHYMKEHGGRTVHTRIRATIKAKKEFEEVGRKVSGGPSEKCFTFRSRSPCGRPHPLDRVSATKIDRFATLSWWANRSYFFLWFHRGNTLCFQSVARQDCPRGCLRV